MPSREFTLTRNIFRCGKSVNGRAARVAAILAASVSSGALAQIITQNYTATSLDVLDPITFAAQEPPDTMGTPGVRDFTQFLNFDFTVFDKSTGAVRQQLSPKQFWANAGVDLSDPSIISISDPRVIYDPQSRRWYASMIDVRANATTGALSGGNRVLFAVSQTSDPAGAWSGTSFLADPSASTLADFPRLGLNHDGVYLATDNFNPAAGDTDLPRTISLFAYNKTDLTQATPNFNNRTNFYNLNPTAAGIVPQPVVNFGPSTGKEQILAIDAGGFSQLDRYDLVGTNPPTLGATTIVSVPATSLPPDARQPGTADLIDTNDNRFSGFVFRVGNSIWAAQSIGFPAGSGTPRSAIRWYQMDATTNALIQPAGTISDTVSDYYMPSIAANQFGDVVMGYTRSSPTEFPSAYAQVGHADASGHTTFGGAILLHPGVAPYDPEQFGLPNRWGDYSVTSVDPADPWTFFTIQEWADEDTDFELGKWATQIAEIVIPHANEARWSGPANGSFATGASWLQGAAPGVADHAIFSRATSTGAAYTVSFSGNMTNTELSVRQGSVNFALGGNTYALSSAGTSVAIAEYGGEPQATFSGGAITSVNTIVATDANANATVALAAATWNNTGNFSLAGSNTTAGGAALMTVASNSSLTVGGTLRVWSGGSLSYSGVALSAGALDANGGLVTLTSAGNHVIVTQSLSIENGGRVELNDNDLIVKYTGATPLSSIRALLIAGYNGGAWNAPGLNSAAAHNNASHLTALGYGEATDLGITSLDGQSFTKAVIVKYTYVGDNSLDGKVDLGNDFNLFLQGFLGKGAGWEFGDYNYDGAINTSDFQLFVDGFKSQGGSLGSLDEILESTSMLTVSQKQAFFAVVPEPAIASISLALCVPFAASRRRRSMQFRRTPKSRIAP